MSITNEYLKGVYDGLVQRNPEQKEFLQAAEEVLESLEPVIAAHPEYEKARPDRAHGGARARGHVPRTLGG